LFVDIRRQIRHQMDLNKTIKIVIDIMFKKGLLIYLNYIQVNLITVTHSQLWKLQFISIQS